MSKGINFLLFKKMLNKNIIIKSFLCFIINFTLSILLYHTFIKYLKNFYIKSRLFFKKNTIKDITPTMGGIVILITSCISIFLFCDLYQPSTYIFLLTLILFGAIGLWDDILKIKNQNGITEKQKFIAQLICASFITFLIYYFYRSNLASNLSVKFIRHISYNFYLINIFLIFWILFVIVGTSNAVNLSDGMDGLAIGSLIPNLFLFFLIFYKNRFINIDFINLYYLSLILIANSIAFLIYNRYPARIFMGDVGSLPLGAVLALLAIFSGYDIILAISGFIFVVETISVIIQVAIYKLYKIRFFKMAPLHHHFELLGYKEKNIVLILTLISIFLCISAYFIIQYIDKF